MGYTTQAVKGFSWMTMLRIITRGITFVRLGVMGRLLTPAQFGFFGIASLLLSLLEIITETGINIFLVQEKDIHKYLNSAWVVSIIRGTLLAGLLVISAPLITLFFKAPEAYQVILLIAFVPLIRGFINPHIVSYQKELQFQKEFQFRFILFLVDASIAILFAFITRNATSFVYGLIASAFVEVILSFLLIPVWPKLQLEYKKVKRIIYRGWWVTITGIFSFFADNGDNIIVGKLLGSTSLGIYQIAYKFSTLPISEITNVINPVVFPVYIKFSEDKKRLLKAFIKVSVLTSITAILLGGIIYLFAENIILLFMGKQWLSAIPAIQILTGYGVLRTIFGNFAPLFLSVGKQDYVAKMTFFRVAGLVVTIVPFVKWYGLIGAGYSALLSILVEVPVILYFAYKVFWYKKSQD